MKTIGLIIALQFLHVLHAANAAVALPGQRLEDSCLPYDANDSFIRAVNCLGGIARTLVTIDNFGTVGSLDNFRRSIEEKRGELLGRSAALPAGVQARINDFFYGILRRVASDYEPLMQRVGTAWQILNPLLKGEVYMCFPDPLGTSQVVAGQEQAACDAAIGLCNLRGEYDKQKSLLVGVRRVDDVQLIMFLSGAKQLVKNGQLYAANPVLQELYLAYADPKTDLSHIFTLESRAAYGLLTDRDNVSVTFYSALTYNRAKEHPHYPDAVKRETVLDKQAILRILSENARAQLVALANPLGQLVRVRMFTAADDRLLQEIQVTIDQIMQVLRATGRTPSGYTKADLIMDYGTEIGKTSIRPEMRAEIRNLLYSQFKIRGMVVPQIATIKTRVKMEVVPDAFKPFVIEKQWVDAEEEGDLSGPMAVSSILFNWMNELDLGFSAPDKAVIKDVLYQLAYSSPQDETNTHQQFLFSLWRLHSMHQYYKGWHDAGERVQFLQGLNPFILDAFSKVTDHKGVPLKCGNGARGRAFLVDLSVIEFLRDKHPEFAMRQ